MVLLGLNVLTHWGQATHICVGNLTIICLDNGLSPGPSQAIIWTSDGILLIGPLGANLSKILIEILTFSFKKMRFKVSSAKWRPFCLGLNWPPGLLHTLGAGNKGIGFFVKSTYSQVYAWCCNYAKNYTVKDMPINNHDHLNIHACSFNMFWNKGCTQSLVVSCKYMYWVVPLISTRVSGYSQVIPLANTNFLHAVNDDIFHLIMPDNMYKWKCVCMYSFCS